MSGDTVKTEEESLYTEKGKRKYKHNVNQLSKWKEGRSKINNQEKKNKESEKGG